MAVILTDDRSHSPVKVTFRIEWGTTRGCEHRGDSLTVLSSRGCFIRTVREARKDDTVFLRLWESPGGGAVLQGKVKYVFRAGLGFPTVGLWVDFVRLSDEHKEHLEHLLDFYGEAEAAEPPPPVVNSCAGVPGRAEG